LSHSSNPVMVRAVGHRYMALRRRTPTLAAVDRRSGTKTGSLVMQDTSAD
jgi:hypothetical protein